MNLDIKHYQSIIAMYAQTTIIALIVLIIGWKIINKLMSMLEKVLKHRKIDENLIPFLVSTLGILLKISISFSAIGMMGIQTTSFIAILGSAGFAVGLALQGSLSNFAGGVMLLIFRPFVVGNVIEAQGFVGTISKVSVFNTYLLTPDNKVIILPNGPLASGPITNFSALEFRRVDFTIGIGYGDDLKKAKEILLNIVANNDKVLSSPDLPFVAVSELATNSVNLSLRVWGKTSDYWALYHQVLEEIKIEFDEAGISFPYPQTDIHIKEMVKLNS